MSTEASVPAEAAPIDTSKDLSDLPTKGPPPPQETAPDGPPPPQEVPPMHWPSFQELFEGNDQVPHTCTAPFSIFHHYVPVPICT